MTATSSGGPRIAIVTHGFELGGGVPTVVRWITESLRETRRYAVDVIDLATSRRDPYSRRIGDARSWLRPSLRPAADRSDHLRWGANAVELEFMRYRPRRELTSFLDSYDLVQVVCGSPAWAAAAVRVSRPVVIQAATLAAWERGSTRARGPLAGRALSRAMTTLAGTAELTALRRADAVMVENDQMARYAREHGAKRVRVAPPGVDVHRFTPPWAGRETTGYLLSVCRLGDPRKGLDRMIRAYAHAVDRNPAVPGLVLAGRGQLGPDVAAVLGSSPARHRIEVRTDVPVDRLAALYRGASAFLQTSYEEGLGISVLEAMATGLPVVSSQTAGTSETVVSGVTGWLVEERADFAEVFADRILDVCLRTGNEFGVAARKRAEEHFSTEATLKRYTDLYAGLLRRP